MALVCPDGGLTTGVICGIDPGSQHLGICMLTIRWSDYSVVAVEARTIKAPTHTGIVEVGKELDRWGRIAYQQRKVATLLADYQPWIVCCESPFYNRFRPSAYAALVECVYAMRLATADYDEHVRFIVYEPAVVKKIVGATAHGTKVAVKTAISQVAELMSVMPAGELDRLDEHSIDSIAVAYTHLLKLRRLVVTP
jgi:Holliday junction resolvasome RuvABC endonuclease subunit